MAEGFAAFWDISRFLGREREEQDQKRDRSGPVLRLACYQFSGTPQFLDWLAALLGQGRAPGWAGRVPPPLLEAEPQAVTTGRIVPTECLGQKAQVATVSCFQGCGH